MSTRRTPPGRRFVITVGVPAYTHTGTPDLERVPEDVLRVRESLSGLGYVPVLDELSRAPGAAGTRSALTRWAARAELGADDVVVLYFAGHGLKAQDGHHLLFHDYEPDLLDDTALRAEDLPRPLMRSGLGHLLVILDTCYAAAGAGDIAKIAVELARTRPPGSANRCVLAAARHKEPAKDGVFADALVHTLKNPNASRRQRFIALGEVTGRINAYFGDHRPAQHARHSTVDNDGDDRFFPNPLHVPGLPTGDLDVQSLERLRRTHAGHFDSRGRGVEHAGETGDYFTGRTRVLRHLTAWLGAERHDRKARVVTGDPGSGKSAVLGRLLMRMDPDHPAREARPARADVGTPVESGTVAAAETPLPGERTVVLHARRVLLQDLLTDLTRVLGLPEPDRDAVLAALRERTDPVAIVVDALDEAGTAGDSTEANRIARELLRPLTVMPAVRLLVGTRRHLIAPLGPATHVIDLDQPEWTEPEDVAAYARAVLLDADDPDSLSPYHEDPASAAQVARGIAERAGNSFLVARMTARAIVDAQTRIDTTRPGWQQRLPADARQAFAAYLARYGPDEDKVRRLLRPLAYAQGAGLPWSTLWAPLATALSGVTCTDDDIRWLHAHAGSYITDTPSHATGPAGDEHVFRLFHETLAEELRTPHHDGHHHALIADTLRNRTPEDPDTGRPEWALAHPYTLHHLATHAAAGGTIDALLDDDDYLTHAATTPLLGALRHTRTEHGRRRAAVYRSSRHEHGNTTPPHRADILALDAARHGRADWAAGFSRNRPCTPQWATSSGIHPAQRQLLAARTDFVWSVACAVVDGRVVAVSGGSDGAVRVWDVVSGEEQAVLTGHTGGVRAVACTTVEDRVVVISGGGDGAVRVWDVVSGEERAVLTGHTGWVMAVACAVVDGRVVAVSGGEDGTVRVWDVVSGEDRAVLTGHTGDVLGVACAVVEGRVVAVSGSNDGTVRVWDVVSGEERAVLTGHTGAVFAVACTTVEGRPVAVSGGGAGDGKVRVWDLVSGEERAVLRGHTGSLVFAVACTAVEGRPVAVSGGGDGTVRVWDALSGEERAVLTGHTRSPVFAVACTAVEGRPVAVSGGGDGTVRVWDALSGQERAALAGHTGGVRAVACITAERGVVAVSGGGDGTLRVWDVASGEERAVLSCNTGWVMAVACAVVDGRVLAVSGGSDGTVRVWDVVSGEERAVLTGHTSGVWAVACAVVEGRVVAVSGSSDRTVRVWDVVSGEERAVLTGHTGWVLAVACAVVEGRVVVVSGGRDGTVRVWDLVSGEERAVLTGHTGTVQAVACTTVDGRVVAVSGGEDGTVRVWDVVSGEERAVLTGHTGTVQAVACTTLDGRVVAVSGGRDNMVRVWDLHTETLMAEVRTAEPVAALASSGRTLILGVGTDVACVRLTV